jgi:hypothetical protein
MTGRAEACVRDGPGAARGRGAGRADTGFAAAAHAPRRAPHRARAATITASP